MIKPGLGLIVRRRVRPVDQFQQRDAIDAKRRALLRALDRQTEQVAVIGGHAVEIAHRQPDGADMHRRAAGPGGERGWVGGIHGGFIEKMRGRSETRFAGWRVSFYRRLTSNMAICVMVRQPAMG